MKMETFDKIISGLSELGRPKTICLYKAGEPLLHPEITSMIHKAKTITDKVWIKSNGIKLTEHKANQLARAGLSVLTISIIAPHKEGYLKLTGKPVEYNDLKRNIGECYKILKGRTWLHIKMADAGFSSAELNKFNADFSGNCDDIGIEYLHQPSLKSNFDYTLGNPKAFGTHGEKLVNKMVCPFPFYSMNFERDGRVTVCSNDYNGETSIGDMRADSVKEIWNGKKLKDFQKKHLYGMRSVNPACEDCDYIQMLPDNIDEARIKILGRLS
jgi:radical SAM protein with 4Fe4S-binding SPASM domain